MFKYWKSQPAVFITYTQRYIRILVGGRKHKYTKYIQQVIEEGTIQSGEIVNEKRLIQQLTSIVKKHKLQGMPTFFSFSHHDLLLRSTTIPLSVPENEWKGYLYLELGESFHLPFADPIIEIVGNHRAGEKVDVIALAVPEKNVTSIESILTKSRLRPVIIDVPFLSLYRLFVEMNEIESNSHVLLIHLEYDVIQLSMFHNHQPVYVRTMSLRPFETFSAFETRTGFQYMTVDGDEMILQDHLATIEKEIARLQSFYQYNLQNGTHSIDTICIGGNHPLISEIASNLRRDNQLAVFHLTEDKWATKDSIHIPASFAELVGLSWK
ncbi:type IV pilus biogenesis protein PilM [Psychrobacillus sp. OK032]|uniref:type IV pilus biogenesis protein PilM n=1 Tax=Psychrobacillus sp. OK032 TaxID=1884358 RepID=UPI0008C45BB5|nr:pilus assembly protein PilM [Psychrobacillus sp. OK032]SER85623.1 type IV pilus assembly protein PilM [Psychrobacillus sp. OK032]